jgi:ribonuclease P/MRP protein subunit RPP1
VPAFAQLSRITVAVPSGRQAGELHRGHPVLASYDVVAAAPGDADAFRALLSGGAVDIVSLELAAGRPPFPLRAEHVAAAAAAGVALELEYAPAVRDPGSRRAFLSNGGALARLLGHGGRRSGGCGLLLSSGARSALELRSPDDAAAIAGLAGLTRDAALSGLGGAGAGRVLAHAEARAAAGGVTAHALNGSASGAHASVNGVSAPKRVPMLATLAARGSS